MVVPSGHRPACHTLWIQEILRILSIRARRMLDAAGFQRFVRYLHQIRLDEYVIREMLLQGAKVDAFGVGERLITSKSDPVFGGVYKLSGVENEKGEITFQKLKYLKMFLR